MSRLRFSYAAATVNKIVRLHHPNYISTPRLSLASIPRLRLKLTSYILSSQWESFYPFSSQLSMSDPIPELVALNPSYSFRRGGDRNPKTLISVIEHRSVHN
jgi:hypothetical protein